jgi:RNA polymerase sigma-70 factor, ECF subfamily
VSRWKDPLRNPEPLIRRVYAYAAYLVGDGPDAEDVTSETFERALRYRASFDADRGEPVAWLLGIARRCADGVLSARQGTPLEVPDQASPQDLETDVLRHLELATALSRLDRRDRELIALRYGADLKARTIADLLGVKSNTVEVALHRALGRLRGLLGSEPVQSEGCKESAGPQVLGTQAAFDRRRSS